MTKVSVIIPFHNVEQYIGRCLESVISQTLPDIEIILVNDASTDMSRNIVSEYALKDNRIKIIDIPERSGQGFARNEAFSLATGKYIGFVDSDDIVDVTMFEKMYNRAEDTQSDIVMCEANLYDEKTGEVSSDDYYSLASLKDFSDKVFSPEDVKDEILNINVVLWNKIYNRDFFISTGVKFVPGYIYEDLPFFFETFLKSKRISIVSEKLYTYRQNRVFSTMQNNDKKVYDRIPMVERTFDVLSSTPFLADKKINIAAWVIDDIFHRYTVLEDKYYEDYYASMKRLFTKIGLTQEEKWQLAEISYCYDEYCSILDSTYYGFWKFLIEKYKTSNQRIRLAEHKCNITVKEVNDYLEEYKNQVSEEKKEINSFWENKLEQETANMNTSWENRLVEEKKEINSFWENKIKEEKKEINIFWEKKINDEKHFLSELSKNKVKHLCATVKLKLKEEENKLKLENERHISELKREAYKYEKMKEIELKNQSVELHRYYKRVIRNREIYHINALKKQKDYYENKYLPVKIVMRVCRKIEQYKNKFKRVLKIN